jgi:uncharacterized protein DUF5988
MEVYPLMSSPSNPPVGIDGHPATERDEGRIKAILTGGPADFPEAFRVRYVPARAGKVKVPFRNGYEHFEHAPALANNDTGHRVFRWTGRTRVAE